VQLEVQDHKEVQGLQVQPVWALLALLDQPEFQVQQVFKEVQASQAPQVLALLVLQVLLALLVLALLVLPE
jgi:hypothetical protein